MRVKAAVVWHFVFGILCHMKKKRWGGSRVICMSWALFSLLRHIFPASVPPLSPGGCPNGRVWREEEEEGIFTSDYFRSPDKKYLKYAIASYNS